VGVRDTAAADKAAFSAFISYSHADGAIAQKLHRKIEAYILPKRLRANHDIFRRDKGKIGPVFRDKEDLPAGMDLSNSVKTGLQVSQNLIILCSPHAKKSPWVNKEIRLFRQLHPDKPILAALISGEPADAFPDALTEDGGEPLAADLRKNGDGWKLGFLKLIAGITNVPLDALIQRDAQRKLRRVTAVTFITAMALLAMIGMTIYAYKQRQEAQEQRVAAEKLVTFMLNDLRSELKGVSTLRVMQKVILEIWEYYKQQGDLSDIPDDSLGLRATILHAMGEDDVTRGDFNKALEKFIEAHRSTKELLERNLNNPDRIFEHAQSEYWVGRTYESKKDYMRAEAYYQYYLKLIDRLYLKENNSKRVLLAKGYSVNNLGIIQLNAYRDLEAARARFKSAVDWFKVATNAYPDDNDIKFFLANAYAWLADTYYREEAYEQSRAYRLLENEIKLALFEDNPENSDIKMKFLISERAIAMHDIKLGSIKAAQKRLLVAKQEALKLWKLDTENQDRKTIYDLICESLKLVS